MRQLLYASNTSRDVSQDVLDDILAASRRNNPRDGITGMLLYVEGGFMQVLEGGRETVNRLYARIANDPRHQDVTLLSYQEIDERRFASWTMGHVNISRLNPSILLKYSERPVLDPYALPGHVSMALLEELIATASIAGR